MGMRGVLEVPYFQLMLQCMFLGPGPRGPDIPLFPKGCFRTFGVWNLPNYNSLAPTLLLPNPSGLGNSSSIMATFLLYVCSHGHKIGHKPSPSTLLGQAVGSHLGAPTDLIGLNSS